MSNNTTVPVRMPEETRVILDEEAKTRGVTLSWLVREILKQYSATHTIKTVRLPAIEFTGKGDEIGDYFKAKES
jgi:predicted DNA-binding protein